MTPRARRLARPTWILLFGLVVLLVSACGGSNSVTLADDSGSPSLAPLVEDEDSESSGAEGTESESEPRGSEDTMPEDADSEGATSGDARTDQIDEPETDTQTDDPTAGLSPEEAAAVNQPLLEESEDARDIEVLSVADGSISSLREAVAGDRPVLLWFWAPH